MPQNFEAGDGANAPVLRFINIGPRFKKLNRGVSGGGAARRPAGTTLAPKGSGRPAAHRGYPLNGRGLVLHTSSPSSSLGNSNSPRLYFCRPPNQIGGVAPNKRSRAGNEVLLRRAKSRCAAQCPEIYKYISGHLELNNQVVA